MLNDKVYLWLVITSCIALAVAGTLAMIEISELTDANAATMANLFAN